MICQKHLTTLIETKLSIFVADKKKEIKDRYSKVVSSFDKTANKRIHTLLHMFRCARENCGKLIKSKRNSFAAYTKEKSLYHTIEKKKEKKLRRSHWMQHHECQMAKRNTHHINEFHLILERLFGRGRRHHHNIPSSFYDYFDFDEFAFAKMVYTNAKCCVCASCAKLVFANSTALCVAIAHNNNNSKQRKRSLCEMCVRATKNGCNWTKHNYVQVWMKGFDDVTNCGILLLHCLAYTI